MEAMFEKALRLRLRFDSPQGSLATEDLWDLPLTSKTGNRANLDSIAVGLYKRTKEAADTVSFVTPSAEDGHNAELQLALEIVKHVISVRVRERDEAKTAADRKERKQKLLALIAQKQDEELAGRPIEELLALAESL